MKKLLSNKSAIQEVTAHDVTEIDLATDSTKHSRLGWIIVLLGVGGFLLWASFAPLDKGVPVSGTVAVATSRKAVQHQAGGTVDEILVQRRAISSKQDRFWSR